MFHNHWGEFASASDLPNVSGSPTQDAALEAGDLAYVTGLGTYQCPTPTSGAAVWTAIGGGGGGSGLQSSIDLARMDYVQQPVPVEESLGKFMFDGSTIPPGASVFLRCVMNPTFGSAGFARVHFYDLGPAAGPPTAPVLITGTLPSTFALEVLASGLAYRQTAALALGPGPAEGVIMSAPRLYEATIIQSSLPGDSVDVGGASIVTEI
jgi:hypothetical protein